MEPMTAPCNALRRPARELEWVPVRPVARRDLSDYLSPGFPDDVNHHRGHSAAPGPSKPEFREVRELHRRVTLAAQSLTGAPCVESDPPSHSSGPSDQGCIHPTGAALRADTVAPARRVWFVGEPVPPHARSDAIPAKAGSVPARPDAHRDRQQTRPAWHWSFASAGAVGNVRAETLGGNRDRARRSIR